MRVKKESWEPRFGSTPGRTVKFDRKTSNCDYKLHRANFFTNKVLEIHKYRKIIVSTFHI